jgi:hypothetical protein
MITPCSARYLVTIEAGMPDSPKARGHHGGLDRVQHVEALGQAAEAVPVVVGVDHPVGLGADAFLAGDLRAPDLEPPVVADFGVDLLHRAAEVERFEDRFLDQRGAARGFHHGRGDVARGDDRVLRRRRGVHQVGFVEGVLVQLDRFRLAHQHLRGL